MATILTACLTAITCLTSLPPANPLPPRQAVMAEYRNHPGPLTGRDVYRIARAVGFNHRKAVEAVRISECESRFHPRTVFTSSRTGDHSFGLMQINMRGALGPARRAYYGLSADEQLLDPVKNLRVAWRMSKGGTEWGPWSCARHIGIA